MQFAAEILQVALVAENMPYSSRQYGIASAPVKKRQLVPQLHETPDHVWSCQTGAANYENPHDQLPVEQ